MAGYVARRLLSLVAVLLGVSVGMFVLAVVVPGDVTAAILGPVGTQEEAQRLREELGLDRPIHVQYWRWLSRVVRGDLGRSIVYRVPVTEIIAERAGRTFLLAVAALGIAVSLGLAAGVLAAVWRRSAVDRLIVVSAVAGNSMPDFWLGLLLILQFAVGLQWFPTGGMSTIGRTDLADRLQHLVLPAVTLATASLAIIARITRTSMLEVLGEEYVRTARAKGLRERVVLGRHALRNAVLPVVTVIGLRFGHLLAGAVITETIFAWPGLGSQLFTSITQRDFPVVQGAVLFIAVVFVVINLLVDLSYAVLDPRIRYG